MKFTHEDRWKILLPVLFLCLTLDLCAGADNTTASVTHGSNNETKDANNTENGHLGNHSMHGNTTHDGNHGNHNTTHSSHGIHVASWNFEYVRQPFLITIFLIITAICKLGFHHAGFLSTIVPESCMLIILGTVVGAITHSTGHAEDFDTEMHPRTFFLFLLPPIILESAYSLHDRVFFENLGTVLLYAVVGTLLNCFMLGPVMFGLAQAGAMGHIQITFIQCLVFSSLIVAVDPVAVLAIFQEIGVNNVLYFLVFGESLLNDAVTVVLYNMMVAFNEMTHIPGEQVGLGFAAFFTVSLGGLSVGIIFGMLTGLVTRFTESVRVVEPLAVFGLAFASYLTAEMFHFSGIISIIGCGLVQAQYSFHNISHKSLTTVTYFSKMLSATSDSIIFLFLGLALVRDNHRWHTGFILWAIVLCLLIRFIVVFFLTFLANSLDRVRKIDLQEQFIMAYGGLRGAVAFSLVAMLKEETNPHKNLFLTATLAVIIFTVFIQGITIKPLVKLLNISMEEKTLSLYEEVNYNVADHIMAGIEEIIGHFGRNVVREAIIRFDDRYLKHILQRNPQRKDDHIMELYHKIALRQHYDNLGGKVVDEKYASSVNLYKPDIISRAESRLNHAADHDVTSNHIMQISDHPELVQQALDDHIRKRKVPSRDVDGTTDTSKYTNDDLRKMIVKNTAHGALHQKYDRNLTEDSGNDLVELLHQKQLRLQRLKHVRSHVSGSCSPTSSMYSSPTGSLSNYPIGGHVATLGAIPEVNSSARLEDMNDDGFAETSEHHDAHRRHHHNHHNHGVYHSSLRGLKHKKKMMKLHHDGRPRAESVGAKMITEKETSFGGHSKPEEPEKDGSTLEEADKREASTPTPTVTKHRRHHKRKESRNTEKKNSENSTERDSPEGSSSKQNSQDAQTSDSMEIPPIRRNTEPVSVGLGGNQDTSSTSNSDRADEVSVDIVTGGENFPPVDTTKL